MSFAVTHSRASGHAPDQRPRDPGEAGRDAEADDTGVVDPGVEPLHHAAADGRAPAAETAADTHGGHAGQVKGDRHPGAAGTQGQVRRPGVPWWCL